MLSSTISNAQKELELWKAQNEEYLSSRIKMTEAVFNSEMAIQDQLYEKQKEFINRSITDELEKNIAIQQLENEHNVAMQSIRDEWKTIQDESKQKLISDQRESSQLDYELELESLTLKGATELEILAAKFENEKTLLDQKLADKKLTEEQYLLSLNNLETSYSEQRIQIKQNEEDAKYQMQMATLGNLTTIFGKQSAIGKALAIASIGIEKARAISEIVANTQVANAKAIAISPLTAGMPMVAINNVMAGISVGAVVASGIKAVSEISSKKLASGGRVWGAGTGTSDSIDAKLSNGETVINAKSSSMFAPFLSAMNVAGGGKAFASGGTVGSSVLSSAIPKLSTSEMSSQQINDLINTKIENRLTEIKVINVTDETASVMEGQKKVKNYANV